MLLESILALQLILYQPIHRDNDILEANIRTEIMPKIGYCESRYEGMKAWNANDGKIGAHSIGKYQWQVESWNDWTRYYGLKNYDIINEANQDDLTLRVIADGQMKKLWKVCSTPEMLAKEIGSY